MIGLSRIDAWFELHNLGYPEYQSAMRGYVEWLRKKSDDEEFEVYAQDQRFFPKAITFPKDEMIGHFGRRFFTSSFAWMMAYALTKGVKEIGLYGIDMADSEEYRRQRAGVHHFLDIAEASGVAISVPSESDILQPAPLYGYERNSPFVCRLETRRNELSSKIAYVKEQRVDLERRICLIKGAMLPTLVDDVTKNPELARSKLAEMEALHKKILYHDAHLSGCRDDVDYMLTIWSGEPSGHAHASSIPAMVAGQPPVEFTSPNPNDIIAIKARKAYGQPIPYQRDDPFVAEPSLLDTDHERPAANGAL